MSLLITLSEALNELQKKYVDEHLAGDYDESKAHGDLFDRYGSTNNRIVIPLEKTKGIVDTEVQRHLAKNGWFVHNYTSGLAGRYVADRDGNKKLQLKSIGKILQQTGGDGINHSQLNDRLVKDRETGKPVVGKDGRYISEKVPQSLLHFYNNDPSRASSNHETNMVISRDRDDIGGMTSGRDWESYSCMRLPHGCDNRDAGTNHKKITNDFKNHTLAVYETKKGDDDIEKPSARILLKRFISHDGSHSIYRIQDGAKDYGNPSHGFKEAVKKFSEDNWPQQEGHHYKLAEDLYNDNGKENIEPVKNGIVTDKTSHSVITQHYVNGRLHDYVDENGEHQPAYREIHKNGKIVEIHYKDDEEHNDNGASTYIRNADGSEYFVHKVNGVLHNPNGASILLKLNGASHREMYGKDYTKLEEYHINGMLHRDGDLPALEEVTKSGNHMKTYAKHGMIHRDNAPAILSINKSNGEKITQYYQWGKLHSPDGIIPSNHQLAKSDGVDIKEWHKNGKLFTGDDRPSSIAKYKHKIVKTWTNENGLEHTDTDRPSSIILDPETRKIRQKMFKKNGFPAERGGKPFLIDSNGTKKFILQDGTQYSEHQHSIDDVDKTWITPNGLKHKIDGSGLIKAPSDYRDSITLEPMTKKGHFFINTGIVECTVDQKGNFYSNMSPTPLNPVIKADKIQLDYIKKALEKGMESPYVGHHFKKIYEKGKHNFEV